MGYLIEPPQPVEGEYVAIFAQTDVADQLALAFLRDNGFEAKAFPLMGDLASEGFGGIFGGSPLFGGESLVCVPVSQAEAATELLATESGLVEEDEYDEGGA